MVTKKAILDYLQQFNDDDHIVLDVHGYIEGRVVCPGRDKDMGYWCSLNKGHTGPCYSSTKGLDFAPVKYGKARYNLVNAAGRLVASKGEPVEQTSPTRVYCRKADAYFYLGKELTESHIEWEPFVTYDAL